MNNHNDDDFTETTEELNHSNIDFKSSYDMNPQKNIKDVKEKNATNFLNKIARSKYSRSPKKNRKFEKENDSRIVPDLQSKVQNLTATPSINTNQTTKDKQNKNNQSETLKSHKRSKSVIPIKDMNNISNHYNRNNETRNSIDLIQKM